jgi:hypothetical protein
MVVLMNYLWLLVMLAACGLVWFFVMRKSYKSAWAVVILNAVLQIGIAAIGPSYLPKGQVHSAAPPPFDFKELEIEDRLRPPAMTEEEREARQRILFDAMQQAEKNREEQ